ncbi:helix-turn-helix domain-containing protein [Ottowia pentelensis]|uniref:helix-turn-helix domain-containing protein n=1 Tax=Ottowia pentelensis TaxID=511108 RepID=UPI00363478E7
MNALPAFSAQPRLQQIALARQSLLTEGTELTEALASAWVDRAWIMQSWRRCLALGHRPQSRVTFDPVPARARADAQDAHATLLAAARPELQRLAAVIAPIRYFVLLTDAQGCVIDTAGAIDHRNRAMHAIARVGVDLSERSVGTTAIGAALGERAPVWLHRGEHFFNDTAVYSCAGAPLFGPDGACLGMLDVTGVEVPERPELKHLVAQSAQNIEDALVLARPHALRLRLAGQLAGQRRRRRRRPAVPGRRRPGHRRQRHRTPDAARPARRGPGPLHASELFALPWAQLFDLARLGEAASVPLWSGLRVQLAAQAPAQPAPSAPRTATRSLKAVEADLIHQAVRQAGGRVADAARALGVSRATVYRRLAGRADARKAEEISTGAARP